MESFKLQVICFVILILSSGLRGTCSLNFEGSILSSFRANIESDPYNSLANWSSNDQNPCNWFGVHCVDGQVRILDLSGLSLGGTLTPELGKLCNLRALVLHTNHLSGAIPKELQHLTLLDVLDLRDNNLTGIIPPEISKLVSLKQLLLSNNNFEGPVPREIEELSLLCELQYDDYLGSVSSRRQFGIRPNTAADSRLDHQNNLDSSYAPHTSRELSEEFNNIESVQDKGDKILQDQTIQQPIPIFRSSGSFPAAGPGKGPFSPTTSDSNSNSNSQQVVDQQPGQITTRPEKGRWTQKKVLVFVAVALGLVFLIVLGIALYFMSRSRCVKPVGRFKSGISGQLQKAFITGASKLNRRELEVACEEFSNIIATFNAVTIFKGTLSSGQEIAVASTRVTSSLDWSEAEELAYRKKIEILSRVNHKNFLNLIGHCEEQEPFTRMMVFEFAPGGNLFEHLHVEEIEHLDWNSRVRIIMGAGYCLRYMHHDLNPPVPHSKLSSKFVYLTDDYAAKVAEIPFEILPKSKKLGEDGPLAGSPYRANQRENVYDFGILLLEIITGRLPHSDEEGALIDWASKYLKDTEQNKEDMVDPRLESVKTKELDIICDVITRCTESDPMHRPTIQTLTSRLQEVIPLTREAAVPRLSPLWWAELELASVEGNN